MNKATSQQKVETDKFGTERYNAIKAELGGRKLSTELRGRFEKAQMVFLHRREIHHQLHNVELEKSYGHWREVENLKQRLKAFKSVEFFIDTMQAVLDEVKKEEAGVLAAKMAKRQPVIQRGWGSR